MNIGPTKNLGYTLLSKTFRIYVLTVIALPAGYINKIIISQDLSVSEMGILYSILSLMGIIVMYNDLGFKESMTYFLPKFLVEHKYNQVKSTLINMLIIQLITAMLISIGLFVLSDWLAQYYFKYPEATGVLQMMIVYLVIQCFNPDSIFLVFQDTFWNKLLSTINMIGVMVCSILIHFYAYHTIKRFALGYILFACLTLIIGTIVLWHKHLKSLRHSTSYERNYPQLKEIMVYAVGILTSNNLVLLISSLDLLLIMGLLGAESAGYYSNYTTLISVVPAIILPIFALILPTTSDLYARGAYKQIQELNSILMTYVLSFAGLAACFGIVFGPDIAAGLIGEKFRYSGQIAQLGFVSVPLSIGAWIIFVMFAGTGIVMQRIKTLLIGLCINLICIAMSIWLGGGVMGVVLSVIVCWSFIGYFAWKNIDHHIKPSVQWGYIARNCFIGLVAAYVLSLYPGVYIFGTTRLDILGGLLVLGGIYSCIIMIVNRKRIGSIYQYVKQHYLSA